MIVVGVTGSIGMGKSTVASQFAALGAKVCNADAIVHALLASDQQIIAQIRKHFPEAMESGKVNRRLLGQSVFSNEKKRLQLEAILHPRVISIENRFIKKNKRLGAKVVVLDIPLLFETGGDVRCDIVVVATAPAIIQKQRVMRRTGMTEEKFLDILDGQMSDASKRAGADLIIATGLGKAHSFRIVKTFMKDMCLA